MSSRNFAPIVISASLASRPLAKAVRAGVFFLAEDTGALYVNKRVAGIPSWVPVGGGSGGPFVQTNGATPLTANWAVGGFKLTGVADPTAAQDAVTKHYVDVPTVTTPSAYPYTTLESDQEVKVDTSVARDIYLVDGATVLDQVIMDGNDLSAANNITVHVANAAKSLNGVANGTVTIATNGALRGFHRDTSGNWHGGV